MNYPTPDYAALFGNSPSSAPYVPLSDVNYSQHRDYRTDPATFQRAYALLDLRSGIIHSAWEANLFVTNVFDKQAALSQYLSDNYSATTRTRMFTNRPRTVGMSLQWKF